MTMCVFPNGGQCCCQPDDGTLCPNASPRDWPEDFGHENGAYLNTCHTCGEVFTGYKRRVTCKLCATPSPIPEGGTPALIGAADKHADDYEGQAIPAQDVRAAITNAFYAGARWKSCTQQAAEALWTGIQALDAVVKNLTDQGRGSSDERHAIAVMMQAREKLRTAGIPEGCTPADAKEDAVRARFGPLLNAFGELQWRSGRGHQVTHEQIEAAFDAIIAAAGSAALPPPPSQDLGNLLARIHRDGGHYIGEHGLEKALQDADDKVVAWLARDEAAAAVPHRESDSVAWLASSGDVSDKDAAHSVLAGRSVAEIQADIAEQRERLAAGVPESDSIGRDGGEVQPSEGSDA